MGGRGFRDLGGKEIGEGVSEVRRGEGNIQVGECVGWRGNGKGNGLEHGSIKLHGTEQGGEIRDRELG